MKSFLPSTARVRPARPLPNRSPFPIRRWPRAALVLAGAVSFMASFGVVASASAAAPTITSFTPASGKLSTAVTITGTNFASPATVAFNGVAATATVSSSTKITTTVPNTASTGKITVTTPGGSAASTAAFTVIPGVTVTASIAPPTTTQTVYFSGFGNYEAADVYFDTADLALASSGGTGAGNATITVPASASPGAHWITVVGRHSGLSAQTLFVVRTNWVQNGYNNRHSASNPFENTLGTGNIANVREAWRVQSTSGVSYGSPAVVSGVLYAADSTAHVNAYSETTGILKWTHATAAACVSSPTVAGGVLYIGDQNGNMYALDANTGATRWTHATGGAVQSSPTVNGGLVYFGSFDHSVYALNANTGALAWSYPTGSGVNSSPAVIGGVVYIGSLDGKVYALDAATGALRWSFTASSAVYDSPAVVNGRVYVGDTSGAFHCLRAATGDQQWSYATGGTILGIPAVVGGVVYVGSGDGKLYAFNASTGAVNWATYLSASGVYQDASVENGIVYTGDLQRTYAVVASYGGVLATIDAGSDIGGAVVVNGAVTINDFYDGLIHYTLKGDGSSSIERPAPGSLRPDMRLRIGSPALPRPAP